MLSWGCGAGLLRGCDRQAWDQANVWQGGGEVGVEGSKETANVWQGEGQALVNYVHKIPPCGTRGAGSA